MTIQLTHRLIDHQEEGRAAELSDLDPSDTRHVLARYQQLDADQVRALTDAVAADTTWRDLPVLERAAVLSRAADHLRARASEMGETIASENGKTRQEATIEVIKSADFLDYYAGMARGSQGMLLADGRPNTYARVLHEPVGLVLAICPWNDPMLTPARKLGPALISGNSVLLKPARDTPLAAVLLEEALLAGGLPPAALGIVVTDHRTLADCVLADPRLAAVTFTGSTDVGMALKQSLAGRNVRVQTEMGGKNAAIVLDDANLDLAVSAVLLGAFGQAGQRCTATSRLLVTSGIKGRLVDAVTAALGSLRVGPSLAEGTVMGPLVTAAHRDDVRGFVDRAGAAGVDVLYGGAVPEDEALIHGCFLQPTLLETASTDVEVWRDEVFGPVLALHEVSDLDAAIELANATSYGLAASVCTGSLAAAETAIRRLDAGQVSVNLPTSGWDVHQPFGGFKESGSPFKEQGEEGLGFYTRVKTAAVRFE